MIRVYARWYFVPLTAVAVVSAIVALQSRLSCTQLRRCTSHRAADDAGAVVAGVLRMAASSAGDDGLCRPICLNTSPTRKVLVSQRHLRSAARELSSLFDCYALTCLSDHASDAVKADVWNCLCVVLEESLNVYLEADALSADTSAAAASLAISELLRGRYRVHRFLPSSAQTQLQLHTLSPHIFAAAARKNKWSGSTLRSLVVFARLLRDSCSCCEQFLLVALVLMSVTHVSRLLLSTAPLATPPRVLYASSVREALLSGADETRVSWKDFCRGALGSLPSRMLAGATIGTLFSHLLAAAQDAASDGLLRHLRVTIKTDTLLALARFDFVADAAWRVPHRVFAALSVATNLSLADVERIFDVFAGHAHRCRVIVEAPLPCITGWATRQGIHYLRRQWSRACLLRSSANAYAGESTALPDAQANRPAQAREDHSRKELTAASQSMRCHRGLQLLLLATAHLPSSSADAVRETLAVHTRWPLFPPASLRATHHALEAVSRTGGASLKAKCDAVQALLMDAHLRDASPLSAHGASVDSICAPSPCPSFPSVLGLLRSQGEDWNAETPPSSPAHRQDSLWDSPSTSEVVVDKVLDGMEGLPLMAVLATRDVRRRPSAADGDGAVEVAFQVMRTVESGDVFPMPPVQPFSSPSAFQFDVEVAQLHYRDHDAYSQSIAAVLFVQQTHQPQLDCCALTRHGMSALPVPSLSASSWRVTFDHVSFHYPGSDIDVLHDVSFDVAAGGFLGIIGYSGAGKSTILLLLSRLYAPTKGQIYLDGCPIDRIPPRMLRRRLGMTWQGDGSTRFLEGLSVARNIAYGALHRASEEAIAEALTAACVSDVVASRQRGSCDVLQSHEWSGGELERLSVARALMVAPEEAGVYVFDECTSGLDSVTEAQVFARGLRARHHVTQIMVSHRLSSVQDASEIVVLAQGRVVERGTWSELLALGKDSLFRTLYEAQQIE